MTLTAPNMDAFTTLAMTRVHEMFAQAIEPGEDIRHTLIMQDMAGLLSPVDLTAVFCRDSWKYDFFQRRFAEIVWKRDAVRVALILPAWSVELPPGVDAMDRPRPRENHAERIEVVELIVGEHGRIDTWRAPVSRDGTAPSVGRWEMFIGESSGVVIDAVREAFA